MAKSSGLGRPTYVGVLACAVSMALSTLTLAQSSAASKPEEAAAQEAPLEVYTGPHIKKLDRPSFPLGELHNEGWVELAFMVDPNGKPFEVTVVRSTGNKTFETTALKAVENSIFEPGTLNGKPVEAGYELKYMFTMDRIDPGARSDFIKAYKALLAAVNAGDRAAADAALQQMTVKNLYEDAYFGVANYIYATKWGDDTQQLESLRRAIARESTAHYLPQSMFRTALLSCMQLELKTHQYAEAMTTWKRLQKSGIDKDTTRLLESKVAQLEKLQADDSAYEVSGVITEKNWLLHLFKPHFSAVVSEGSISEARLRCDKHYVFFAFDTSMQYRVNSKDGKCSLEFVGTPGTRFKLIQF